MAFSCGLYSSAVTSKNMSGNDMYSTKVAFHILWCGQRDGLFCLRCGFAWQLLASRQGILAPLFMDNVGFGQLSFVCGLVFNFTRKRRCAPLSRMEVHCGFVGAVWCADTLEDVDLLSQLFVTQQGGHGEGCGNRVRGWWSRTHEHPTWHGVVGGRTAKREVWR